MYLSILFFILAIFLYTKTRTSILNKIFFIFLISISSLYWLSFLVIDFFTGEGFNEAVIYHIKYGFQGAGFFSYWQLFVLFLLNIILIGFLAFWIIKKDKSKKIIKKFVIISYLLISICLIVNPLSADLYGFYADKKEAGNIENYEKYYHEPSMQKITENKNLVMIYAEGLEETYFNQEVFPDLTKNLNKLKERSDSYTNIKTVYGTSWTIGGMVGSQCGLPLITYGASNNLSGMEDFLPLATCLGDLLKQEEYHLVYMGGASLSFAGKGEFYQTHGFDEVYGRDELFSILGSDLYHNNWGLYDDSLFGLVYEKYEKLAKTEDKFALVTLTLDTHHPDGDPSKSCADIKYQDGSNEMLNAVACSDYLISELINKIILSDYADDTVIVLLSDHLAHKNAAFDELNKLDRKNLLMVIDPSENSKKINNNLGSSLDIGPTILPYLGYEVNLGLGRDLNDLNRNQSEIEYIQENLKCWEKGFINFWKFPTIRDDITIDINKNILKIDDNIFALPALITLNEKLETNVKTKDVSNKYLSLTPGERYILIDDFQTNVYHLISGQIGVFEQKEIISDNLVLNKFKIKEMFNL